MKYESKVRCADCRAARLRGDHSACEDCRAARRASFAAMSEEQKEAIRTSRRGRPSTWIKVTPDELDVEAVLYGSIEPHRVAAIDRREVAKILIRRGDLSAAEIARRSGMSERNVFRWRARLRKEAA